MTKKLLLSLLLVGSLASALSFAGESCSVTVDCGNGQVSCSVSIDPGTVSCTSTANSVTCSAFAADGSLVSSNTRECGQGPDFSAICARFPFLSICN